MVLSRIYWQRSRLANYHHHHNPTRTPSTANPSRCFWKNPLSRTIIIMMSDHLNATGLTAEESRKLTPRAEREDERTIIRCIKEVSHPVPKSLHRLRTHPDMLRSWQLYSCKPSEQSYEMYAENATFHDPLVSDSLLVCTMFTLVTAM
jgi:hypothetical protein